MSSDIHHHDDDDDDNNNNNNNNNDSLSEDLIFSEILPKLPVKPLIRFKSVSKLWHFIISSSNFAKTHLKSSSSHPHFLFLAKIVRKLKYDIFSVSYDEFTCNVSEFLELKYNVPFKYPEIVGSCNGLVCLLVNDRINSPTSLYIWNPATHLHRQITIPEDEFWTMPSRCVLHYAPSSDDYKIFAAFSSKADQFAHFYVFSLRGGTWERICVLNECVPINNLRELVLFHDTLYFAPPMTLARNNHRIVGFDLVAEEFKELPSMNGVDKWYQVRLMQLRGCLSLVFSSYAYSVADVWMLKETNELNSWEKVFSLNLKNVQYYSFSETTSKCLVRFKGKIKVVDPSWETLQLHQGGIDFDFIVVDNANGNGYRAIFSPIRKSVDYVESLIAPF